ncbi:HAMP domain-containing protein [Piscirickettsia litoralis]|uniref:histidine kinase n=1 Tax=Piscirickettsia litoralis TaxID=1891921 RepID=A0ABX2ZZ74_9GAMM|nr:HAMP domain-containing protein [Piscirickettsia litoralis]ODN41922.1 hypothetical protein BGC07_01770 [Piscirickettsia litoralis]
MKAKLNIKLKLVLMFVAVSLVAIFATALILGLVSTNSSQQSLEQQAKSQLISIREVKKSQIENYFKMVSNIVISSANNIAFAQAAQEFIQSYNLFDQQEALPENYKNQVKSYYHQLFIKEYELQNAGKRPDVKAMLKGLTDTTYALQYAYIANNANPLGEKDKLNQATGAASYNVVHDKYHPTIRTLLQQFGFYDIFIADIDTGNIVYSVYKELDYATSLKNGPYANSGIGQAFKMAVSGVRNKTYLTDFKDYLPSYNGKASFIATPLFVDGKPIAILIAQMPIDKINNIMTYNEKWSKAGLGSSGETYLVGSDYKMRSISRFLVEDEPGYLNLMKSLNVPQATLALMKAKATSIGLQTVKTAGTEKALSGKTGFSIFDDYRGVPVLSAYTPVNIGSGIQWALMSEIDESEAFAPAYSLKKSLLLYTIITVIIILLIMTLIGYLAANYFSKQILALRNIAKSIASGNLDNQIDVSSIDELGDLQQSLKDMQEEIKVRNTDQERAQQEQQKRMQFEKETAEKEHELERQRQENERRQQEEELEKI